MSAGARGPAQLRADACGGDAVRGEHPRGKGELVSKKPEQQVLTADILVSERACLVRR